jgi:hypothetical protein
MANEYPKRKCLNPNCPNIWFTPRRLDHLHCDGCKNKKHNAQRKKDNETIFARERVLRHNMRRLKYVHETGFYPETVPVEIIKHEKINLRVYTDTGKNAQTGGTVFWSHDYGIEVISKVPRPIFQIHKR